MTEDRRSQVVELLEQQKYDEALPMLGGMRELDPADRELQIYHLLVVRILILRWNLTGATAKRVFFLRTKIQRIITGVISLTRATFETHVIPVLGRIYPAIGTWVVLHGVKRIIIVVAGIGLFLGILIPVGENKAHVARSSLSAKAIVEVTEPTFGSAAE